MAEQVDPKQTFDYQAFVNELATQAQAVVPVDISEDDKKYITRIVYNFCNLACEAILKEPNFSLEEDTLITQFIGEWTFHKAIDLIRAGIAPQLRDQILQNIAFTVFEISKQAVSKKLNQTQVIQIVEHHVKKSYMESLTKLKEQGIISEDDYNRAMGESNIDKMAESQEEELIEENEFSTSKLLKLASLAMVLKKMPQEKAESILSKVPEKERIYIKNYMQDNDLSSNIGGETFMKYFLELKSNVPKALHINESKLQNKFSKIVTKKNEAKINAIILQERDGVKEYVLSSKARENSELSSHVSNVIYNYLAEKIK